MCKQRGATLIEVLVSVLVLAVGLLGLSATQVMTLKNGSGAHHRYMAALAVEGGLSACVPTPPASSKVGTTK